MNLSIEYSSTQSWHSTNSSERRQPSTLSARRQLATVSECSDCSYCIDAVRLISTGFQHALFTARLEMTRMRREASGLFPYPPPFPHSLRGGWDQRRDDTAPAH